MVADAIPGSTWSLPHPRSHEEVDLHAYLTTLSLLLDPNINDEHEWISCDTSLRIFRSSTTWEVLRPRIETKDWTDVVWFKRAVLKYSFTMWTANYEMLPTKSRLAGWGLPISANCSFCSRFVETILCCHANSVRKFGGMCLSDANHHKPCSCAGPSSFLESELLKLAAQTVVFHLWKQRNTLIHNDTSLPPVSVLYCINKELRNILSARRLSKQLHSLMVMWLR